MQRNQRKFEHGLLISRPEILTIRLPTDPQCKQRTESFFTVLQHDNVGLALYISATNVHINQHIIDKPLITPRHQLTSDVKDKICRQNKIKSAGKKKQNFPIVSDLRA